MCKILKLQCVKKECKHIWLTKTDKVPQNCPRCGAKLIYKPNRPKVLKVIEL